MTIVGKRCEVEDDFVVKIRRKRLSKQGTIVGFYLNEYWHPYLYRAFHIEFDDGSKDTHIAKDVKICS